MTPHPERFGQMNRRFENATSDRKRATSLVMFVLVALCSLGAAPVLPRVFEGNEGQTQTEEVEELIVLSVLRRTTPRRRFQKTSACCKKHVYVAGNAGPPRMPRAIVGHRLANDLRAPCRC